jgi:hypothetical protein
MNSKICKAGRRLARQLSAGMPDRELLGMTRKVKRARKGKPVEYDAQQAVNNPRSTRGIYRAIKRALRRGVPITRLLSAGVETAPAP